MKNCPFCSEMIQDAAIKCRFCGEWLESKVPNAGDSVQELAEYASDDNRYAHEDRTIEHKRTIELIDPKLQGVDGWLLLFVVGQLVCSPLRFIGELGSDNPSLSQISARYPQMADLLSFERFMTIVLVAFGVAVAIMLLSVKNRTSVLVVKWYLSTTAFLAAVVTVFYAFTDLPDNVRSQLIGQSVGHMIAVGISCLIWFMYFTKSKRVRATYLSDPGLTTVRQQEESGENIDIWQCDNCQREVAFDVNICPHCGADVSEVRSG